MFISSYVNIYSQIFILQPTQIQNQK